MGNKRPGCVDDNGNDLNGGRNKDQTKCEDTTSNTWDPITVPQCSNGDYNTKYACDTIGTWKTEVTNNMTAMGTVDPAIDESHMQYMKNQQILSLCEHDNIKKTCEQVTENKLIPDICLFTGFKEINKDGRGLKFVAEEWGLGTWGQIFSITAISLSGIHLLCNIFSKMCGGYCNCFNSCCTGLKGFPCCASKYMVETGCICSPESPKEDRNIGVGKYDSCSQCGSLTFLTLWTVVTFFFFTMVGESIVMDQCYGAVHGSETTVQDFIEALPETAWARINLEARVFSYIIIIILISIHGLAFFVALIMWGCSMKPNSMNSHYLVSGFSNNVRDEENLTEASTGASKPTDNQVVRMVRGGMTYNRVNIVDIELNGGLKF